MNTAPLFLDCNPERFFSSVLFLLFLLALALKLDGTVTWSCWIILVPLFVWKLYVFAAAIFGIVVFLKHPSRRLEAIYRCELISVLIYSLNLFFLLIFEILICLNYGNVFHAPWIVCFIPAITICLVDTWAFLWSFRHNRSWKIQVFIAVNVVTLIFIGLRLDEFLKWKYSRVLWPLWVTMSFALLASFYKSVFATLRLCLNLSVSNLPISWTDLFGNTVMVLSALIAQILVTRRIDKEINSQFIFIFIPFYFSVLLWALTSFGTTDNSVWWLLVRKNFCEAVLGICKCLREYGNIKYVKEHRRSEADALEAAVATKDSSVIVSDRPVTPSVLCIDIPD